MTSRAQPGRMPAVFLGHGSPMNVIRANPWAPAWEALGAALPAPRAILTVSAHWYVGATLLTAGERPRTIHDFGGFPRELYEIDYPARGDDRLARRVAGLLADRGAAPSGDWGFDHGAWSVLRSLRPAADVPVVQLSVDRRLPPAEHLAIGRALAPLRDEGVLILGSGNVVHNLRAAFRTMETGDTTLPPWAATFDAAVAAALAGRDDDALVRALERDDARAAHPSPDHYLPLLYVAGAADRDEPARVVAEGWDLGSVSMRGVRIG